MALSHGIGSETRKPLAVVIIGGLISATFLTSSFTDAHLVFEAPALPGRPRGKRPVCRRVLIEIFLREAPRIGVA